MTPTTSAVRAACDAANPGIEDPCEWPTCSEKCQSHMLTTLLANARAEGAAGERERWVNPVRPEWPRPGWNVGLSPEAAELIDAVMWWRGDCPDAAVTLVNSAKPDQRMFAAIADYKAAAIRARDAKEASGG